jgi:hypothetical protein
VAIEPQERFLDNFFRRVGVDPEEHEIAAQWRLLAMILIEDGAVRKRIGWRLLSGARLYAGRDCAGLRHRARQSKSTVTQTVRLTQLRFVCIDANCD